MKWCKWIGLSAETEVEVTRGLSEYACWAMPTVGFAYARQSELWDKVLTN
ncbi:hypothetical protein QUB63_01140 [Microcoleus sp. ARI1-B5]